jgi:hypothetical protein
MQLLAQRRILSQLILVPEVQTVQQVPEHALLRAIGLLVGAVPGQRLPLAEQLPAHVLQGVIVELLCQKLTNGQGQGGPVLGKIVIAGHEMLQSRLRGVSSIENDLASGGKRDWMGKRPGPSGPGSRIYSASSVTFLRMMVLVGTSLARRMGL